MCKFLPSRKSNNVTLSQNGCNGTTSTDDPFNVSGYVITIHTGDSHTAQVNSSETEISSDVLQCSKGTGKELNIK